MEEELRKGGEICRRIKEGLPKRVVPGTTLLSVAEWIEGEIRKAGAEPTFPTNISIDEVAAHFTPAPDDKQEFQEGQLVKIDFGAHVNGWPTDNAVTFDLGDHDELLQASRDALESAESILQSRGPEATLSEIGKAIEDAIKGRGFNPITNLTGHKMDRWVLHAGLSIYNYDSGSSRAIGEGLFAIEPFATTGAGQVKHGAGSEIYRFMKAKRQRLPNLRRLANEVKHFRTLPFCSRWVSSPQYLTMLVKDGTLHNYPMLVEKAEGMVSQAEHSFLVSEDGSERIT